MRHPLSTLAFAFAGSVVTFVSSAEAQIVFEQSFGAGGLTSDYVGAGANQFNAISTSNSAGFNWAISGNALEGVRTANAGAATRSTDLAITAGAIYEFTINVVDVTAGATSSVVFAVGSGFGTANAVPDNADIHSRFSINLIDAATDGFQVRDIASSTNFATTFTGTQSLFFVVNNSGGSLSYTAPDASVGSVADDTWDLWVGTTQAFNDAAATTASQTLTDFKLVFPGSTSTVQFDNFRVTAIPEPSVLVGLLAGFGWLGLARRRG